jgi:hypothetical protein
MNVGSVGSSAVSALLPKALPQAAAPAVQDNDGDSDHGAPDGKSATSPGVGTVVDQKA